MITALIVVHSLVSVALLGAITHQALAVAIKRPELRTASFLTRFRTTDAASYGTAVVALFVVAAILGATLYPHYRLDVRPLLRNLDMRAANGAFEIKEHLSALGLLMLPAYWACWRHPLAAEYQSVCLYLTWIIALIVWWNFLVGEVLVALKGLVP